MSDRGHIPESRQREKPRDDLKWIFDPNKNHWTRAGRRDGPADESYVFGRLRFDADLNGAWLHVYNEDRHETWFYRFRAR